MPPQDSSFTLDPAELQQRKSANARRVHAVQIPLVRLIGFAVLCFMAVINTPGSRQDDPALWALVAASLGYSLLSWAALWRFYGRTGRLDLSLLFGQGRSDHAVFADAGIPVVFFTDANAPCYHTTGDELEIVDFPKLVQQEATAEALTRDLMNTDTVPTYDPTAPAASYDDVTTMLHIASKATADFGRFSDADRAAAEQFVVDLQAIADAGPDTFDDTAVGVLLSGSITLVSAWESGECDGFLVPVEG